MQKVYLITEGFCDDGCVPRAVFTNEKSANAYLWRFFGDSEGEVIELDMYDSSVEEVVTKKATYFIFGNRDYMLLELDHIYDCEWETPVIEQEPWDGEKPMYKRYHWLYQVTATDISEAFALAAKAHKENLVRTGKLKDE